MERPKNRSEYQKNLAQMFSDILSEKGLEWKKQWQGMAIDSPINGITKARYRGCNAFYLSLNSMMNGYQDPRWLTMVQIMDKNNSYHPGEKWHLKKGSKATYVEYWYPYDFSNNKAITWTQYKDELLSGRLEEEFLLKTRYTAVFNADNIEGISEIKLPENLEVSEEEIIVKLSTNMNVPILNDGGDRAFYSVTEDKIHLPER